MKHYDCRYYLTIDVFKGLCKRDAHRVLADDLACENYENARKCKHCLNFTLTTTDMGLCMSIYDAYPEMNAMTCDEYERKT